MTQELAKAFDGYHTKSTIGDDGKVHLRTWVTPKGVQYFAKRIQSPAQDLEAVEVQQ